MTEKRFLKASMLILATIFITGVVYAECASITGNASVDAACCVDPTNLTYTDSAGEATHDDYVDCVGGAAKQFISFDDPAEVHNKLAEWKQAVGLADASAVNQ